MANDPLIIAFDGDCLLCSKSARFLARRDHADRLRFTRLQDKTGKAMKDELGDETLDSIIVKSGNKLSCRSTAVLNALLVLEWHWRLIARIGLIIPRTLRDAFYNFVAKRRYRWFGKNETCNIPGKELTRRIITDDAD